MTSYTRTLTANPNGAFPLSIETNSVRFKMFAENRQDIVVELTAVDGQDSEAGRAVDTAWGELERNRYRLFVENPRNVISVSGVSYGNGNVQVNSFGGVTVTGSISGNMSVINGRVYIDGVEQTPGGRNSSSKGIVATVRFPKHSPVTIETQSGSFDIEGEIGELDADSSSGSINAAEVASAKVRVSSGSFGANAIYGRTDLRASSGNLSVAYLNGPFDIAVSSGNVRIGQIHAAGEVEASSGNINVRAFDGEYLKLRASSGNIEHPEGDDRITAKVSSGSINGRSPRRNRW
jgi:hypothetical protein